MMNKDKKDKFLDDVSKMAGGVVTMVSGATKQIKGEMRSRVDDWGHKMDFVPREDFERLEALVQDLSKKVANLEGRKTPKTASKPKAVKAAHKKAKPASKKTAAKKPSALKKKAAPKKSTAKKTALKKTTAKKTTAKKTSTKPKTPKK